jgi:hypothetical protein
MNTDEVYAAAAAKRKRTTEDEVTNQSKKRKCVTKERKKLLNDFAKQEVKTLDELMKQRECLECKQSFNLPFKSLNESMWIDRNLLSLHDALCAQIKGSKQVHVNASFEGLAIEYGPTSAHDTIVDSVQVKIKIEDN